MVLQISGSHLAYLFLKNPGLKILKARGCVNLIPRGTSEEAIQSYFCKELYRCLGNSCKLEKISLGWGFCSLALEPLRPAIFSLRALTIGVGGSLGEDALRLLPTTCPLLESLALYFQVRLINCHVYLFQQRKFLVKKGPFKKCKKANQKRSFILQVPKVEDQN